MMTMSNQAPRALAVVQRKYAVRTSDPNLHTPPRQSALAKAAEALSRRNLQAAHAEVANEALSALVTLCYERDASGELCNVDPHDGRLLVPLPWGRNGHKHWGLRASEAVIMRAIMLKRQATWTNTQRPLLLTYDPTSRTWLLNRHDYGTPEAAAFWLSKSRIKLAEWRAAYSVWKAARTPMLDGEHA